MVSAQKQNFLSARLFAVEHPEMIVGKRVSHYNTKIWHSLALCLRPPLKVFVMSNRDCS